MKIAILGAGINGLSCAVKIREKYSNIEVVIFSKEFTPNTTGDGCGGLWYPYLCGKTPESLLRKWGGETYYFLHQLWLEGGYNICVMPLYELHRKKRNLTIQEWSKYVFGYRILEGKQLEYFNKLSPIKYWAGRTFTTFITHPPTIMSYLHERFSNANGRLVQHEIKSMDDPLLLEYDVIINCSGLGAREIVPDEAVFSIRGQISHVLAPWMNETIMDEDSGNYIIPNAVACVLGGTHQINDYNTNIVDEDVNYVLYGCREFMPSLKDAKLVRHWTGLRPGRHEIRLESKEKDGKLYIHNYGHGGSGFTLFWGCASDVLQLLEKHKIGSKSKL